MRNRDFASKQLKLIQKRIELAARKANRSTSEISLIGASKQQKSQMIEVFHNSGLINFGENYLNEALNKRSELSKNDICWHFIGRLQSNKCKLVAHNFDWVHTIDRLKVAQSLSRLDPDKNLNVLIQINIDNESSKGGTSLPDLPRLSDEIAQLKNLQLRGFMLIPKASNHLEDQQRPFAIAKETLDNINQTYGLSMDTLSMGMSNDLEAAILEGSTMIRVGTALFGPRINPLQA